MSKIDGKNLDLGYQYICENCDEIYKALFEFHFLDAEANRVIKELKEYQNEDGGFGHGLEPDFLLPQSSPLATTIAFQILKEINTTDEEIVKKAINYYENTFDKNRQGWKTAPKAVNSFPHAPWWHYNENENGTVVDRSWGNPTGEIIGTLYKYREQLKTIDIDILLVTAISYFNNKQQFTAESEIYCFIRLFEHLPQEQREKIKDTLFSAIENLVCLDEADWANYVPKPLDFIKTKNHPLYETVAEHTKRNIDYLIDSMNEGVWYPSWEWSAYETDWQKSKKNWVGRLTIKNYLILREFERI